MAVGHQRLVRPASANQQGSARQTHDTEEPVRNQPPRHRAQSKARQPSEDKKHHERTRPERACPSLATAQKDSVLANASQFANNTNRRANRPKPKAFLQELRFHKLISPRRNIRIRNLRQTSFQKAGRTPSHDDRRTSAAHLRNRCAHHPRRSNQESVELEGPGALPCAQVLCPRQLGHLHHHQSSVQSSSAVTAIEATQKNKKSLFVGPFSDLSMHT